MALLEENAEVHERLSKVGAEQQADGSHVQVHEKDVGEHRGGDQIDDRAHAEGDRTLLHAKECTRQLVVDRHVDTESDQQDQVLACPRGRKDRLPEPVRAERSDQRPDQRRRLQRPERGLEDSTAALWILMVEEEAEERVDQAESGHDRNGKNDA